MRLPSKGGAIFRYTIDIWPVGIVLGATALGLTPFIWPMPPWLVFALWIGVLYLRTFCAYAQHNHAHIPVFRVWGLNRLYDAVLALNTGYPSALWELHHNRGHHRNFLRPDDDVASPWYKGTRAAMPRWRYALRGNLTIHRDAICIGLAERRAGRKTFLPKLAFEVLLQVALAFALFRYQPWLAIAFFVIPNAFLSWMVWWEAYPHHLDMPGTTVYDASVTIENPRYNLLTFNVGHHAAHHQKPTLHWSFLPGQTEKIRTLLHDASVRRDYATAAVRVLRS